MKPDLIIRGSTVVLPETVAPAAIHIKNGRIMHVASYELTTPDCEVIDAVDSEVIMAGMVDTHVHVNEPGRTEWEGFTSATKAAAAGGTTTLIDMPLNSIPATTSVSALMAKMKAAKEKCYVDTGFWGGVIPGNASEIEPLFRAGVIGFKCFLVPSGVDEFPHVTEHDLNEAMPELTRLDALLIVHAELPEQSEDNSQSTDQDQTQYQTFLSSRPCQDENRAIELMTKLSRKFDTRVHIVHLSSAEALPILRQAQMSAVKISAETCPHYLHFTAEDIEAGATEFKCCPPIRESENREALWRGLVDGTVKTIVSDHSPCPANMKLREQGDFLKAWGGISSVQLRLPIVWTQARHRGHSLLDLSRWLCSEPAKLVNLGSKKGMIAEGHDADLVIWDPEATFEVNAAMLHHQHKLTPYSGQTLSGLVQKTFLRGQKIYDRGEFSIEPIGDLLLAPHAAAK